MARGNFGPAAVQSSKHANAGRIVNRDALFPSGNPNSRHDEDDPKGIVTGILFARFKKLLIRRRFSGKQRTKSSMHRMADGLIVLLADVVDQPLVISVG